MKRSRQLDTILALCILLGAVVAEAEDQQEKQKMRLFILSGQSNMAGLDPGLSFTPTVKAAFPDDEIVVVKDAKGGEPIRRWYKKWKPAEPSPNHKIVANGDLYDQLMKKVNAALKGKQRPDTISFVWMQGERDARLRFGEVYAESMKGLIRQLRDDLARQDMCFVIGRLSDFGNGNTRYAHWDEVRAAQVAVAEADPCGAWVDTDDLNGEKNALHYSAAGYKTLGERFALKAIAQIQRPTL